MKKMIMPVLVMSLALMSCKKNDNTETAVSTTDSTATAVVTNDTATAATGDTTAISVDWAGAYAGTLPCASCPGIETQLTLNDDKTYTLESNYLEEKDGKFTDQGTFTFSDDGSFITLKDAKKADENRVFFVGEGKVWMAEKVGDRSMKKDYQLVKQ
ncbi:lipoprotein involved with copper homeostasis and adhesion [Chryseobacterium taklimakanense]|uniref:Lipoprotein involved with copper homeostasis and adhesion n=1 Tax=Chryseobacterium taklimakanense TaxID=536441 RepID=A0A239WS24_9FLAO|nr:copper resistance protein NlpE [Chryseobacterium taklimakanense]SNV36723.1 lipoprotein involved with copper homeostasis and adhesion [Chryseobacterium taklimakanense]